MALENLFVRVKKSIGGIQLDAVISENHVSSVEFTSNPVEYGAEITDHAVVLPKEVVIDAHVSDTPLGIAAVGQIIDNVTGLFGSSTSENVTRSVAAYNDIIKLQESADPLEIQTGLKLYTNMGITNVTVVRDIKTSRAVRMLISLKELLIVKTEVAQLEPNQLESGDVTKQGSPPVDSGRKQPITPDASTEKTWLLQLTDLVGITE